MPQHLALWPPIRPPLPFLQTLPSRRGVAAAPAVEGEAHLPRRKLIAPVNKSPISYKVFRKILRAITMMISEVARSIVPQALLLCVLVLSGCGESVATLNKLAASGSIHKGAPVIAHVQTYIAASPERVWELLIDAPSWSTWASQIESVNSSGPLTNGSSFTWNSGGTTIHSQVQVFEPERRLSWTGRALTATAVRVWELSPGPSGGTTVTVNESMDGPLMSLFYSAAKLAEAERAWLSALKQAAEGKSRVPKTTPTQANSADLRATDFKNFAYPWVHPNGWPDHLQWMSLRLDSSIRLVDGKWDERSAADRIAGVPFSGLTLEEVQFANLSSDQTQDAIAILRYDSGGTQYHHWVYIYGDEEGHPKLLGFFHAGDRAAHGLYRVAAKDKILNVDLFDPSLQQGDCCSSGYLDNRFRWSGRGFEEVGPPIPATPGQLSRLPVSMFGVHP